MSAPQNTGRSRDAKGKWLKGTPSPNPGGRPATPREVAAYFAGHTLAAAEKVVALMNDADADPQDQLRAAMHVLDRSLGKPMQALDVTAHRGADAGAVGGNPDAARARLEALIEAATASATDTRTVALPEKAESVQALGEKEAGEPCPVVAKGTDGGAQ